MDEGDSYTCTINYSFPALYTPDEEIAYTIVWEVVTCTDGFTYEIADDSRSATIYLVSAEDDNYTEGCVLKATVYNASGIKVYSSEFTAAENESSY